MEIEKEVVEKLIDNMSLTLVDRSDISINIEMRSHYGRDLLAVKGDELGVSNIILNGERADIDSEDLDGLVERYLVIVDRYVNQYTDLLSYY